MSCPRWSLSTSTGSTAATRTESWKPRLRTGDSCFSSKQTRDSADPCSATACTSVCPPTTWPSGGSTEYKRSPGAPPLPLTSRRYAREYNEVKDVGALASITLTAIRQLDGDDGNPDTQADPGWTSLLNAPPYPDHPSGLSALGAAMARTLQDFYGTDKTTFGTTTTAGLTRSYDRFSQAASEIVDACVWSGIHSGTPTSRVRGSASRSPAGATGATSPHKTSRRPSRP